MGIFEVVVIIASLALLILIGYRIGAGRPKREERELRDWAKAHALELTPGNDAFVRQYLRTGHRLRVRCMVGGFIITSGAEEALRPGESTSQSFVGLLVGYLVGTLWAEFSLTRPQAGAARSAALVPRRLEDYLPGRLRLSLRVVGPFTAAAWVATRFLPYRADDPGFSTDESLGVALAAAGFALVVPVLVEVTQRWVLRRPQPLVAPEMVAADDAVRSASLHFLGGTGVAIVLVVLGGAMFRLANTDVQVLRWTMPWTAIASFVLAMVFWRYYSHRAWRVQRRLPIAPAPAPS